MSSYTQGSSFEEKIYRFFSKQISAEAFAFKSECCKIFRQKGYYSKARDDLIKFDISIEICLPGRNSYSMLWLIECKNYTNSVPVNDAEEFYAKLQQVAPANGKGVIASAGTFQRGTVQYSASQGIGLLQYVNQAKYNWILDRLSSDSEFNISYAPSSQDASDVHRSLTSDLYRNRYFDFSCFGGSVFTHSLRDFFLALAKEAVEDYSELAGSETAPSRHQSLVTYISQDQIEECSAAVLRSIGYLEGAVPLGEICKWQAAQCGLQVRRSEKKLERGALGHITFRPLVIVVYVCSDDRYAGRQRFTLAHELGHHFLHHSRYILSEYCEEVDFEISSNDVGAAPPDIRRMEWQANQFASCLLLPKVAFESEARALALKHGLRDRGHGLIFIDEQYCNQDASRRIINSLSLRYRVSQRAIKIRLRTLNLLNDVRDRT